MYGLEYPPTLRLDFWAIKFLRNPFALIPQLLSICYDISSIVAYLQIYIHISAQLP